MQFCTVWFSKTALYKSKKEGNHQILMQSSNTLSIKMTDIRSLVIAEMYDMTFSRKNVLTF